MGNTMKAADLHRVIAEAKNFAGRDATLPMLQNVRIEATETQLVAVATDRFLLGVSRADYAGEAFTVSVEGQQVDALLRMAKTAKRDEDWREVTIERRDDDTTWNSASIPAKRSPLRRPTTSSRIPAADTRHRDAGNRDPHDGRFRFQRSQLGEVRQDRRRSRDAGLHAWRQADRRADR